MLLLVQGRPHVDPVIRYTTVPELEVPIRIQRI